MYFEPLISVKCCPKVHIKQLRNNLNYICLKLHVLDCRPTVRSGWVGGGGSQMKRGGPKGGSGPPDPPLDTPMASEFN